MRRVSFFMGKDTYEHLQTIYDREGVPMATSIRFAINAYLREKGFKVAESRKGGKAKKS